MDSALLIFSVISSLLALLSGCILFFINKEQVFSNRLLAVVLFFFSVQNFLVFLLYSGLMVKIPNIYRVFGPTTFLILPVSYIYVRSILRKETNFQKYDWLILIPAILYAINLIPVYTLPYEKKLALVTQFVANPKMQSQFNDGYLPPYVFSFIRTGWSTIFIVLQFKLISQFRKKVTNQIIEINKELLQWLTLFTVLLLSLIVVYIVFTFAAPIFKVTPKSTEVALQLIVFIIAVKLFTQPQVLYGIYIPSAKFNFEDRNSTVVKENNETRDDSFKNDIFIKTVQMNLDYKEKINAHFKEHVPFLNPNYNLNNLVDEIHMPRYLLSSFINQEYGMNFRKFLNRKRIEYIIENFKKPEWKNLTLEAIANESGFGNRSTFIINFKEVTGKNPLEYFKSAK